MPEQLAVAIEAGAKRCFAVAIEWPGWSRAARDERGALEALAACGPRYASAVGRAARGLRPPRDGSGFSVVERLRGNATTDFGAPGIPAKADARPLDPAETKRQAALLRAAWAAFDAAAAAARGKDLTTGPRGGGRSLDAIVTHAIEADRAYLHALGGAARPGTGPPATEAARLRAAIVELLAARARGEDPPLSPRRRAPLWLPRFFVRRSAWHALDHAWEIEDRTTGKPS